MDVKRKWFLERSFIVGIVLMIVVVVLLAGCGSDGSEAPTNEPNGGSYDYPVTDEGTWYEPVPGTKVWCIYSYKGGYACPVVEKSELN